MTSLPNEFDTPGVSYGWVSLTQVVERGHLHSTQPRDEEVL